MENDYIKVLAPLPKYVWRSIAQFQQGTPMGDAAAYLLEIYFANTRQAFSR